MRKNLGFTLIEVIIVIAIVGVTYYVAIPQFNLATGTETAVKLGQVASDIRGAYDTAVLTGKTYRMVFMLATGDYWLEVADRNDLLLGDDKLGRDPTAEEEKAKLDEFNDKFQTYVELGETEVRDPESDRPIKLSSPVVSAKNRLQPIKWQRVEDMEWGPRSFGPYMIVQDMRAEHHNAKQTFEELGEKARAFIYFFPQGYVERAVIHIGFKRGELQIDPDQEAYTVITSPTDGTAEVLPEYVELAEDEGF